MEAELMLSELRLNPHRPAAQFGAWSGQVGTSRRGTDFPQFVHSLCKGSRAAFHSRRHLHSKPEQRTKGERGVNQDQIWSQVQEELRFQLAKRTYDMWLKNTSVVSADGGTFPIAG